MKNQTKQTLEDAIPTLIEGWNVMSGETIESEKEPQFEVIEFNETFHIIYSWFYGEKRSLTDDPELSEDLKQFEKSTIIIDKSKPFSDFVYQIVHALDAIAENKYIYEL